MYTSSLYHPIPPCNTPTTPILRETTNIALMSILNMRARSHWLLRCHMTANNETVSRKIPWAGNVAKSITSVGKSALLPVNDDCSRELFYKFVHEKVFLRGLYSKSLKEWSRAKQLKFASLGRFSGNKINCFSRDQSFSVYYITYVLNHFLVLDLNNWRLLLPSIGNL